MAKQIVAKASRLSSRIKKPLDQLAAQKKSMDETSALHEEILKFREAINPLLLKTHPIKEELSDCLGTSFHIDSNMQLADLLCAMIQTYSGQKIERPSGSEFSQPDAIMSGDGKGRLDFWCHSYHIGMTGGQVARTAVDRAGLVLAETFGQHWENEGPSHLNVSVPVHVNAIEIYKLLKPILDAAPDKKQAAIDALWAERDKADIAEARAKFEKAKAAVAPFARRVRAESQAPSASRTTDK